MTRKPKTFAEYQKMRREEPRRYSSAKTQYEMMLDRQTLGKDEFYAEPRQRLVARDVETGRFLDLGGSSLRKVEPENEDLTNEIKDLKEEIARLKAERSRGDE